MGGTLPRARPADHGGPPPGHPWIRGFSARIAGAYAPLTDAADFASLRSPQIRRASRTRSRWLMFGGSAMPTRSRTCVKEPCELRSTCVRRRYARRLRRRTPGFPRLTALLPHQEARDVLEELPGHVGIPPCERPEVPELHRVAAHRRERLDGRRAFGFADHRELAEVVARTHRADPLAVDDDGGLPLGDREEGHAAHLSLLGEHRARGKGTVPEVLRELAELSLAETAEQRNTLQILGDARHAATLSEPR